MKLYASPLQGFTEAPWRNIHHELFGGIDAYYTPFVRVEKGEFRNKDIRADCKGKARGQHSGDGADGRVGKAGRFVFGTRIS